MISTLTAAEYRAQNARKGTATRTAAPRPTNTTPAPHEAGRGPEIPPPHFAPVDGPRSWLLPGGQAVTLAGNHYGDRFRLVLTGKRDADFTHLLAYLLAYQPPTV